MQRRLARAGLRAGLATIAVGSAALAYGVLVERDAYALRHLTLPLLPAGSPSLRVLHLSDLHLRPPTTRHDARLARWVRDLARLAPDLVVATGDFLAGPDAVPAVVAALGPLLERPGLFVPGNADHFAPVPKSPTRYLTHRRKHGAPLPWGDLAAALAASGWRDLTHRRERLTVGGLDLEVRGVDDPFLGRDDYSLVAGAADLAADLRLGLAHAPEPRILDAMTADGLDLVLAGHTHGGQVRLPLVGALVTNCGIDRARARGLSRWTSGQRTTALHVSAGLGTSPYAPMRLGCRPEVTLLALTSPDQPRRAPTSTGVGWRRTSGCSAAW